MKEMTWTLAYFSPTGGTCKIARAIAAGSGCRCVELDLTDPHFAVPQAGSDLFTDSGPPCLAAEFHRFVCSGWQCFKGKASMRLLW